jgi:hypothetical protein
MVKLGGNGVSPEPKKPKRVALDGGTHRVLYFSVWVTACRPVAEPSGSRPWVCPGAVVFNGLFAQIYFIRNILINDFIFTGNKIFSDFVYMMIIHLAWNNPK